MEEDVEEILRMAVRNGGSVSFAATDLMNRTMPYRYRLNRFLRLYGELTDVDSSYMWAEFIINERGRRLVSSGGFRGDRLKKTSGLLETPAKAVSILGNIFSFIKSLFILAVILYILL